MKLFTGLLLAVFLLLATSFNVQAAGCGSGGRFFNGRVANAFRAIFRPAAKVVAATATAPVRLFTTNRKSSDCAECAIAEAAQRAAPVSPPSIPLIVKPKGDPSAPLPTFNFKPK